MNTLHLRITAFIFYALYLLYSSIDATHMMMLLIILSGMLIIDLSPNRKVKLIVYGLEILILWNFPSYYLASVFLIEASIPIYFFALIIPLLFTLETTQIILVLGLSILFYNYALLDHKKRCLQRQNILFENQLQSFQIHAQNKQKQLLLSQKQDLEISVLNERNRIARDIHDNVGHLLTSALLQVGALQSKQNSVQLDLLKSTLDKGMNAIRQSVHELYNYSEVLENEIHSLIDEFPSIQSNMKYHLTQEPKTSIRATFLFAIKEALNNTLKHSNATEFFLQMDESSNHFYCIISDNGTSTHTSTAPGIGLLSLEKRVKAEHGIINIQPELGYRIYISIPKE